MALLEVDNKDVEGDDEKKGPSPLPFPSPAGLNLPSFVIFLLQASLPPCLFYSTRDCAPSSAVPTVPTVPCVRVCHVPPLLYAPACLRC